MISGLTKRQRDCLIAIARHTVDGVSPTYDELATDLGLASKSGIHHLLCELKARGAITFKPGKPRSVRIIRQRLDVAELESRDSADLRTLMAHVAGILAHRDGGETTFRTLDRIGRRLSGRPLHLVENG